MQKPENLVLNKDWPIDGGKTSASNTQSKSELLITGHEDGQIRFWKVNMNTMTNLARKSFDKVIILSILPTLVFICLKLLLSRSVSRIR